MEKEIKATIISPKDLPKGLALLMYHLYDVERPGFKVMHDYKSGALYVNEEVPSEDVGKFLSIANFEGEYLNEPDTPISKVVDEMIDKYGIHVYFCLFDVYKNRMKARKQREAREKAVRIAGAIRAFEADEEVYSPVLDNEFLIQYIGEAGNQTGRRTAHNAISQGIEYQFLFGYLLGKGIVSV